ncbi:hypothetical protein VKT23_008462 [Stygiomarasmius scandens]|uniref:Uncharacterized protein n=1 Tax=Marasmiellus scandens TaxID=2682957 RepID=A0ABR1JJB3_9AGAR
MHPQNAGLGADDEHDRTNRFEYTGDPPLPSSSHRAASQPPRTSTDQPFLSSPVISNRSPWSTQNRLLTPGGVGIPVPPMNSRSASFSHAHLGGGGSGGGSSASTSSSYFASAMRERSFSSTFEDDESEELADDASAIVGRLAPGGGDPYDDDGDGDTFDLGYEPSSYHGRPGIGTGGGRLPPSLSSSISPSMLSTPANPMTRGRTFAPDLSRSRSQSLATATATRPLAIGASYGGYGTAGLGSAISSWNGDEGYLSSGLGGMGKFGEIRRLVVFFFPVSFLRVPHAVTIGSFHHHRRLLPKQTALLFKPTITSCFHHSLYTASLTLSPATDTANWLHISIHTTASAQSQSHSG